METSAGVYILIVVGIALVATGVVKLIRELWLDADATSDDAAE